MLFRTSLVLLASFLGQLTFAMSMSSSECAVVGCGVLGTSLCKQMLASPEFMDWKGRLSHGARLVFYLDRRNQVKLLLICLSLHLLPMNE